MNKYSHDAGVCLLSLDGERSIIVPKERVTRVKHDGGDCAAATQHALDAVGATLDDVVVACANNHHFRIAPFEKRAPWQTALGINFGVESTVSPYNLLPTVPRHEVSHHLAHAWSVLTQAPFDEGLIVVMDGMGELREEMLKALATHEAGYHTDELLPVEDEASGGFQEVPAAFDPLLSYREAESVYSFKGTELKRVFKRWQPHNSPPTLYNHGFENMESLGAVYSRVSSHVFGDWNACGKVMGLAPWAAPWTMAAATAAEKAAAAAATGGASGSDADGGGGVGGAREGEVQLFHGSLDGVGDDALRVDWAAIEALPHPNGWRGLPDGYAPIVGTAEEAGVAAPQQTAAQQEALDAEEARVAAEDAEVRAFLASLSLSTQAELERVAVDFLARLQKRTGAKNLCLAGGVALNSVLNGRLAREAGFDNFFVPPYPGDEGIAFGCAAFALHRLAPTVAEDAPPEPPPWRKPMSAYQGRAYSDAEVAAAIEEHAPWLTMADGSDASAEAAAAVLAAERADGAGDAEAAETAETQSDRLASAEEAAAAAAEMAGLTAAQQAAVAGAVEALLSGEVVAWFDGRAEVGARALGSRSMLADPRRAEMHEKVNRIKRREMFRPLAPSVLAEHAQEWFDGVPDSEGGGSPYMSITASTREAMRELIPAVTHVDGSARLQTVDKDDAPLYHALIFAFFLAAGVPLVLNTSYNSAGMPIVESAADAVRCFLDSPLELTRLFLQGVELRRKPFPTSGSAAVAAARPLQQAAFVSRSVADAYGEPRRVEVLADGRWVALEDPLELEVLERSTGDMCVAQLAAELAEEFVGGEGDGGGGDGGGGEGGGEGVEVAEMAKEVEARLRHLYGLRLISME